LKDDLDIKPKKQEIGFIHNGKIFADVCILKNSLKFWINLKKGALDDPKKVARDVATIGHWGNGDYEVMVNSTDNLEYVLFLIKQAL
jgi:predicted transport protein